MRRVLLGACVWWCRRRRHRGRGTGHGPGRRATATPAGVRHAHTERRVAAHSNAGYRHAVHPARCPGHHAAGEGLLGIPPIPRRVTARSHRLPCAARGDQPSRTRTGHVLQPTGQRPVRSADTDAVTRNRVFQPLGIVPFTPRFSGQQLDVREQVTGIYLFEEDLPVNDSFTITYAGLSSEDWQNRQPVLDRERARIASRARSGARDTTPADSAR